LQPRDTVLLASDGLFDNLYKDEIVAHIRSGPLTRASTELMRECGERMSSANGDGPSKADDLTFILFRMR
jgi:protein phosphatase